MVLDIDWQSNLDSAASGCHQESASLISCPLSSHRLTIIVTARFPLRNQQLYTRSSMLEEHATELEDPFGVPKRLKNHPELERRGIQLSDMMRPVGVSKLPVYPTLITDFLEGTSVLVI